MSWIYERPFDLVLKKRRPSAARGALWPLPKERKRATLDAEPTGIRGMSPRVLCVAAAAGRLDFVLK